MNETHPSVAPSPNMGDPPPFNRMAADAFEEMCCALLAKETGITSADLFGGPRELQYGIDVIGKIENGGTVVISCKCYSVIKRGQLSQWSDDFLNHWNTHWQKRQVRRFILAVAADVKSSPRQREIEAEKLRFAELGIDYEVWPPRHLQEQLRSHTGLVAQFLGNEWVPRICGIAGLSISNPQELLNKRCSHCQALEFEEAANCAEEAARLAREMNDKNTLFSALRCAARDLGDLVVSKRPNEKITEQIMSRIKSHILDIETLDVPEAELAIEKALFARLERNANAALKYAKIAEKKTSEPETYAEALMVQLEAFWQLKTPEAGLKLQKRVQEITTKLKTGETVLNLQGYWLRTLCKTSKSTNKDIQNYIACVKKLISNDGVSPNCAIVQLNDVVSEFCWARELSIAIPLIDLALELATNMHDPPRAATIAIQFAEVEAEIGNEAAAKKHLGTADKWLDILKTSGDTKGWTNRKVTAIATRGRIESRLASKTERSDYDKSLLQHKAAFDAFNDALKFMDAHEADLVGDVGPFRAELRLWLGDAASALGRHSEASEHYSKVRTEQIMADVRFRGIGISAWPREATALLFAGKPNKARSLLVEILGSPLATDELRADAKKNISWLDEHVLSVLEWFDSDAAKNICKIVTSEPEGLRRAISEQMHPLIEWFHEFPPEDGAGHACSELYDVWGRGGFSRIVAAVRADPLNSISVDATCIGDIIMWARVFCPLYDTVIVNWKGHLGAGFAVVPMPDNLGPPGEFGGQGYARTSSTLKEKAGWHVATGWGNFLPKDVSEFLATEALPLIKSGRLVLLPAPLVGCTQSAVGWTDNLLVDTLLGGVVKIARKSLKDVSTTTKDSEFRLLDLGTVTVPFIDNIPLCDLDRVLDDTAEWLSPLRRLLQGAIGSSNLRHERWDSLRPYFTDIRDAFRQIDDHWRSLIASRQKDAGWRITEVTGTFSASSRRYDSPGFDAITDLLRSTAVSSPDLGPWIPYWCLREAGGQINWTKPLDNRSIPPDELACFQGSSSPISQGWLYPGDGGPGVRYIHTFPSGE